MNENCSAHRWDNSTGRCFHCGILKSDWKMITTSDPETPPLQTEILDRLRSALNGLRGEDQKRIADVGVKIIDTLLRKNHDYGNSAWTVPILAPGVDIRTAIFCRMSDKVQRISQLQKLDKSEVAESLADTVCDLAGYAILLLGAPEGGV